MQGNEENGLALCVYLVLVSSVLLESVLGFVTVVVQ